MRYSQGGSFRSVCSEYLAFGIQRAHASVSSILPTFANGRSWPNRDARSATSSSTQCDPLGKLMPRVGDPVCIPRLHANHFQHEDGTRCIKREQLAAAVSAKAKEAGSVRRNLQVTVTRFDLIGAPQRGAAHAARAGADVV